MSAAAPAVKRSRREVVARRPEEEKWAMSSAPASASKVATVDERRNVMRNLPDPRHFPGIELLAPFLSYVHTLWSNSLLRTYALFLKYHCLHLR